MAGGLPSGLVGGLAGGGRAAVASGPTRDGATDAGVSRNVDVGVDCDRVIGAALAPMQDKRFGSPNGLFGS